MTLTEFNILKSRAGVYEDTAENRRLHRVGQRYGEQKQAEEKKEDVKKPKLNDLKELKGHKVSEKEKRLEKFLEEELERRKKANDTTAEEPKFSRVNFPEMPNAGKVNLKKYLSEKGKQEVGAWTSKLDRLSDEELNELHGKRVANFNRIFNDASKSDRAKLLYEIMKIKAEIAKRSLSAPEKEPVVVEEKKEAELPIKNLVSDFEKNKISRLPMPSCTPYIKALEENKSSWENIIEENKKAIKEERYFSWGISSEEKARQNIARAEERVEKCEAEIKLVLERKKELTKKKKELLNSVNGRDMTEEQVNEWVRDFVPEKPAATVRNAWKYSVGRYGSTSATINLGNVKDIPFDSKDVPSWRPIGVLEYKVKIDLPVAGQKAEYETVRVPIQSWKDVTEALSDMENQTLYIYKHPIQ